MSKKITTLQLCGKTSDACSIVFLDGDKNVIGGRNDYVPDYFPEKHYGDYIEFNIDVATGQILNWIPPTQEQLKNSME